MYFFYFERQILIGIAFKIALKLLRMLGLDAEYLSDAFFSSVLHLLLFPNVYIKK